MLREPVYRFNGVKVTKEEMDFLCSGPDTLRVYEKPQIVKKEKMTFPIDIIEADGRGVVCRQCSSCHNCR